MTPDDSAARCMESRGKNAHFTKKTYLQHQDGRYSKLGLRVGYSFALGHYVRGLGSLKYGRLGFSNRLLHRSHGVWLFRKLAISCAITAPYGLPEAKLKC